MFKTERSHKEFQNHLVFLLNLYYANDHFFRTVFLNASIIFKAFLTDLIPVRDILLSSYHPRGETPWDPVCLFRSYWLMCQYGDGGSITRWVNKLKSEPFWAIISGFYPGNVPGVGTFYDFEDRLCDFDSTHRVERCTKMHKPLSKPKKKLKKNQKQPPKHQGVTRVWSRGWLTVSLETRINLSPKELINFSSRYSKNVLFYPLPEEVSWEILLTWLFPVTAWF